jgi:hypothetical protein
MMRVSYHCRFLQTGSVLQLHCQSFTLPDRVQFNKHCWFKTRPSSDRLTITPGLCLKPTVIAWSSLPVCGSSRQCWLHHHCRFVVQADSDVLIITASSWLKPTVMSWSSLPAWGSSWQCWLDHHCRFVAKPTVMLKTSLPACGST